jgi:RNA polymerase sigma-70 factor (ECF subfamily)
MSADGAFRELIQRVRGGDPEAAAELVRLYEPEIRRFGRMRLTDAHLRRTVDLSDILQSVLLNFFVRAANGQFELEKPEQLINLLKTMAQNKLVDRARRESVRKTQDVDANVLASQAGPDGTPSSIVAQEELLQEACRRMTPEELQLAERRARGWTWQEIAAEIGRTAEAARKIWERAKKRVRRELGLDGDFHA